MNNVIIKAVINNIKENIYGQQHLDKMMYQRKKANRKGNWNELMIF